MKKLHEIVKERYETQLILSKAKKEFQDLEKLLSSKISDLSTLENIGEAGLNLSLVQLAETVMYIRGNPFGITDDGGSYLISSAAINDIANNCEHLKKEYYGNKTYSGYYQRCDCRYGYGPSHGGICDEIGLQDAARKRDLTDDEKDACIYYIKNYKKIKELAVS